MRRLRLAGLCGLMLLGSLAAAPLGQTTRFVATFDEPESGTPRWVPPGWDWTLDLGTTDQGSVFLDPNLITPPACDGSQQPADTSQSADYATWKCPDHLVFRTASASYGHQFLTPPALMDFTQGESVFSWDMSTLRTSGRDWIELWVSPLAESVPNPDGRYFYAAPQDGLLFELMTNPPFWGGYSFRNSQRTPIPGNTWTGWNAFLTPSGSRLDRFELHLTRTHVKFGMPAYNFWWVDADVVDLGWNQGVVQLGQAVYKSNIDGGITNWALDNVAVQPAAPLTILRGDTQSVQAGQATVRLPQPASPGAILKWIGLGSSQSVSIDGGATFQRVAAMPASMALQGHPFGENSEHYTPYQVAIPTGVQTIQFQGQDVTWFTGAWEAHDIAVYAPSSAAPTPVPTPVPATPTLPPSPTPQPSTTAIPSPVPTPQNPRCVQVADDGQGGLRVTVPPDATCPP